MLLDSPDSPNASAPRDSWAEVPVRRLDLDPDQLDLGRTLASGQAFRWRADGTGAWIGVVAGHVARLASAPGALLVQSVPEWPLDRVADYFRLADDLTDIRRRLAQDAALLPLLMEQPGLRLLRQPPAETLFAFICSAANNIPRITRGVETIAAALGEPLVEVEGRLHHAFPSPERLAACDVDHLCALTRLGWRPRRLAEAAAVLVQRGPGWLDGLRDVSHPAARAALLTLPGVGRKIADCVCLFALDQASAVPVDTHIWQAAVEHYRPDWRGRALTAARYDAVGAMLRERHGDLAGWAQQYLFAARAVRPPGAG